MIGWWKRRTRTQKLLLLLGAVAVVVAAIAAPSPNEEPDSSSVAPDSILPFVGSLSTSSTAITPTLTASSTTRLPSTTIATVIATTAVAVGEGRVTKVIDGDTVVVFSDGAEEEVRLIGIDAPETGEAFSADATEGLTKLVGGTNVRLELDVETHDQYDRRLAYIWVGQTMVNAELLWRGLATVYTVPPNVKYVERFQAAQDEAQAAQLGMWGEPTDSPLRIVAVEYDAPGDDSLNLNEEYITFEVVVSGALLGYSVEDQTGHRYRFPDRVFKRGDVFKLHSGEGTDTRTDLHWGAFGAAIWNNDGDTVKLLDPQDQIVESYDY
ncbi:MAG: hypothetical protein A2133_05815 [Actinobacteria bacterium RBG_16_64_13]|nr:MAG: hypothetical protein A2133_05815 [Actinobacteria bacterium RBG_16_64_13]